VTLNSRPVQEPCTKFGFRLTGLCIFRRSVQSPGWAGYPTCLPCTEEPLVLPVRYILQVECRLSCHPTNSVKALKEKQQVYSSNNRSLLPNFIQIGRHLGELRRNNLLSTRNRGQPRLYSKVINNNNNTFNNNFRRILGEGSQPSQVTRERVPSCSKGYY